MEIYKIITHQGKPLDRNVSSLHYHDTNFVSQYNIIYYDRVHTSSLQEQNKQDTSYW